MATAPEESVKPANSLPQLPLIKTPRFTGGKLASIRKKIDEKQLLLDGGIPPQLLKHAEFEIGNEFLREEEEEAATGDGVSRDDTSKKKEDIVEDKEKDTKSVLCTFCGRNFAADRVLVHREICKESLERSSQIPFIVKLGLQCVDGDKDKDLSELTPGKEELVKVAKTESAEGGVDTEGENEYNQEDYEEEEEGEEEDEEVVDTDTYFVHHETTNALPATLQFPGGGYNWTEEHALYMDHLFKARQTMEQFALGNFPNLPPPPGPNELEIEYVQCPHCLGRFTENYSAFDHLIKCSKSVKNGKFSTCNPAFLNS